MSDEEGVSLSESEGEGPNIRPPQPAGEVSKKKHKSKRREYDRHHGGRDGGGGGHKSHREKDFDRENKRDREMQGMKRVFC